MYHLISYEEKENVAVISLENPKKKNAISFEMMDEIHDVLDKLEDRPDIRAVIIWGNEELFCAGMDVTRKRTADEYTPQAAVVVPNALHKLYDRIEKFPKAVIAAVAGYALGGGLELALSCDIRIFSKNAKVGLPEVRLGTIPCGGGTQRLARIIGTGRAKEYIFTCERMDAEEAYRVGLANRLSEEGHLLEDALALAEKIAGVAPLGVSAAKKAVNEGIEVDIRTGMEMETTIFSTLKCTDDYKEGMSAFAEKRKPVFTGK